MNFYCFFVHFSSFPIFNFGIVHYGSRPFEILLYEAEVCTTFPMVFFSAEVKFSVSGVKPYYSQPF